MMSNASRKILIVAGEASADRYGASLVERLHSMHGSGRLDFFGTGGDAMAVSGVHLSGHIRDLAHIGVREALSSLHTYYKIYRCLINTCKEQPPALAVLLDFPEFNLRLAKKLKRLDIKVVYYISPQIWAWRSGRIRKIRKYVDKMLVILPFEEDYYRARGIEAEYVGHPLLEDFDPVYSRESLVQRWKLDSKRKTIAILPGSRRREIDHILPTLLQAAQRVDRVMPAQFLISAAPSVDAGSIRDTMRRVLGNSMDSGNYRCLTENSRDLLASADFAFVKSGTSSLEAALTGTPFLVTYKISPLSWFVGTLLIRSPMMGLVNLIAGEEVVPELFQDRATPEALARVALDFLGEPGKGEEMRQRLYEIRKRLSVRCASETAAAAVNNFL